MAFTIPPRALQAQLNASHPQTSVWVSANAGSGKTHVLTQRVIRLLLEGVAPSKILCLTYTKAAAAVMKTRIFERLANWAILDDEALKNALAEIDDKKCEPLHLLQARRLFAQALETPGGLKIQTIHGFCEALLHQFPLEANIAGHFDMLDELKSDQILKKVQKDTIIGAQHSDTSQNVAFSKVFSAVGEFGLENLFKCVIAKRHMMSAFLKRFDEKGRRQHLYQLFGLHDDDNMAGLLSQLKCVSAIDPAWLGPIKTEGGKSIQQFIEKLAPLRHLEQQSDILACVETAYFTKTGIASMKRLVTKPLKAIWPLAEEDLTNKQAEVVALVEKIKALELIELNLAAYILSEDLIQRYDYQKQVQGVLDFDDLIHYTLALLERPNAGQWVQYKLDKGIEHILVDEAQDTGPEQWQIILKLAEEFFAGAGQNPHQRTTFAVGDEKQSIYSFQGAEPAGFALNGQIIARQSRQSLKRFERVRLDYSFRSTPEVLSAVDIVFSKEENAKGLSLFNEKILHEPVRANDPGQVDIWPPFCPESIEEPQDWRQPVDLLSEPAVRLAQTISDQIAYWLEHASVLKAKNRRLKAGDILVLVRKRGQFVHALTQALKNKNVPVAGADRLVLTDNIAVQDLLALARFILQPHDDLSLASLFKSPLFDLSEDDLFEVAARRQTKSLWQALCEASDNGHEKYADMVKRLKTYRRLADNVPVFEFYSTLLAKDGGRKAMVSRLGWQVSDVIDVFLDFTLDIQQTGLPGLQVFLQKLEDMSPEIKRELDQSQDEVRIMTVHGAKGMEAPVVFLVDPGSAPAQSRDHGLLNCELHNINTPIWPAKKQVSTALTQTIKQALAAKSEEEYRRLLYVGMTRAEDYLIICGYQGKRSCQNTWVQLVEEALSAECEEIENKAFATKARRYRRGGESPIIFDETCDEGDISTIACKDLPHYLLTPLKSAKPLIPPLIASQSNAAFEVDNQEGDHLLYASPIFEAAAKRDNAAFAIERGKAIHELLQYIPAIAPPKQAQFIDNFWLRSRYAFTPIEREKIKCDILALMDNKMLKALWAPGSKGEVSIMGQVQLGSKDYNVSAQIDRLQILPDQIILADFKTGMVATSLEAIGLIYLRQMALYKALLAQLYPKHTIRAMLVYTQDCSIFELDDGVLERALKAPMP